ncbi:MAG: hypothetical protein ACI9JY_000623, partial [Saprospiraceae bacterium]
MRRQTFTVKPPFFSFSFLLNVQSNGSKCGEN